MTGSTPLRIFPRDWLDGLSTEAMWLERFYPEQWRRRGFSGYRTIEDWLVGALMMADRFPVSRYEVFDIDWSVWGPLEE